MDMVRSSIVGEFYQEYDLLKRSFDLIKDLPPSPKKSKRAPP